MLSASSYLFGLRLAIGAGVDKIEDALRKWMGYAQHCRIPEFWVFPRKISVTTSGSLSHRTYRGL